MAEYKAIKPDSDIYGVFPTALAQSLAQPSGNPYIDNINRLALMQRGSSGTDDYTALMREAQIAQREGQAAADLSERQKAAIGIIPAVLATPKSAGVDLNALTGTNAIDNNYLRGGDAVELDRLTKAALQDTGAAFEKFSASGTSVPDQFKSDALAGPFDTQGPAVTSTPYTQLHVKKQEADAATERARADMISALKPPSDGGGSSSSGVRFSMSDDGTMRATGKDVGSVMAAMEAAKGGTPAGGSIARVDPAFDAKPLEAKIAAYRLAAKRGYRHKDNGTTVTFVDPKGTSVTYDKKTNTRLK